MISDYRCFFCFTKAFERLIEKENLSVNDKNQLTCDLAGLYVKCREDFSAPAFSRDLYAILKQFTNCSDPYKEEKKKSNDLVLGMYPQLKEQILHSANPFDTALRLAIAGNIIDYAVSTEFNLKSTIEKVFQSDFAIDHSDELKQALSEANTVLYLGDNSGEIVLDKLFIEHIRHPNLYYAVRGAPVINDSTMEDVKYVGMDKVAHVISNGYDAPSTIIEHCSTEFRGLFNQADVIISKGQGNLEGLLGKTNKVVYFLLMVKCDVIADALHVRNGDFVVIRNNTKI
ncbi:MAG TPA: hypothetical protein DEO70_08585 [Bacteroidales bacterium]|nr:MAG: hypothetical protein A2X11_16460 [Bacteroidetes bacterium GWE2_42_24]OFY26376.1 MAG: hypothetical protein A2X09_00235 [Bacteroidetes bacterium GWF2_43_11]HBZ66883.1 hypothetical protein [Bacteroidales bacterium]